MSKARLYIILSAACVAAYGWLCYVSFVNPSFQTSGETVCLFKNTTGIPCPSCGSSRSVFSLLHGNFWESVLWNPLGIVLAAVMLTAPLWMVFDLTAKKETLFRFYLRLEKLLQGRWVAAPAIVFILLNWLWNIHKGL